MKCLRLGSVSHLHLLDDLLDTLLLGLNQRLDESLPKHWKIVHAGAGPVHSTLAGSTHAGVDLAQQAFLFAVRRILPQPGREPGRHTIGRHTSTEQKALRVGLGQQSFLQHFSDYS